MSLVIFSYNGIETTIQCKKDDKICDIINKFKLKSNIKNDDIYYLYDGHKIINLDLSFYNQANLFDKERNQINIIVIDNKEKSIKEVSIK